MSAWTRLEHSNVLAALNIQKLRCQERLTHSDSRSYPTKEQSRVLEGNVKGSWVNWGSSDGYAFYFSSEI